MPINKTYEAPITLGFVPDDGDLIRGTVNGAEVNGQWIGAEGYASLYLKGNTDVLLCKIGFYGEQAFVAVVQTSAPTTDYELHLYRYVPASIVKIPQRYVDGLEETTANANRALENAATAKSAADTAKSTADTAKSTANALTCELIYQGTSWTQSNVTSGCWNFASYNNGIWIAGSNSDKGLFYSTNGKTWTQSNVASGNCYFALYNNEIWVADSSDVLYYSTDGKTWTRSNGGTSDCILASYNNGIWIAGSVNGRGLFYSMDGKTWTKSNITDNSFEKNCISYGGIWVAGPSSGNIGILYSEDGKTWTQSDTKLSIKCIRYENGIWVASSLSDGLLYSMDGKTWTQSNETSGMYDKIVYGGGIWIALESQFQTTTPMYSTDGKKWYRCNVTLERWNFASYSNGIWIAGSNSNKGLFYSTNGRTWTQSNIASGNYYFASYNNEIWVAGSKSGEGLFYSIDGKTWIQSDIKSGNYYLASYNNGIWVSGSIDDDIGIYHSINKYALTKDVEEMTRSATVIPSSTSGSTKKFKITVDDTGTISATEVT